MSSSLEDASSKPTPYTFFVGRHVFELDSNAFPAMRRLFELDSYALLT
jgi:hypothetical protein